MVCFPWQYHIREPAEKASTNDVLVTRGAKEPRSVYLGGRAEVRRLLLGGRAEKKAYKQRVQVEDEFCRYFSCRGGVSGKI